jgi:NAD(P)-dependent dehydrogenase (short-subunit alcohol dehydrogenase family)
MRDEMRKKVAFVTGAASGIGRAAALAFAREGARVVCADTLQGEGERTAIMIRERDGEAEFVRCDVSDAASVGNAVKKTLSLYGSLDFAFNNAGVEGQLAPTAECSEANWDKVLGVNLKGIWLCLKNEIPVMLKQGGGAIVNCASIAGLVGFEGLPAYVASKHGVVGLTKTAALECAKKGIRINAVCPGAIRTPMLERVAGGAKEADVKFAPYEPVGRIGKPEEIAEAVIWLCSSKSSFVTGQALAVDGGWVAQ